MILYFIPIISACTGWVAVRFYLNSTLLRKRKSAAKAIGAYAANLINFDSIADKLKDPAQLQSLSPIIEAHIDTFLRSKLQEKIPMIATFIGESTIVKLKDGMMEEINSLLPQVLGKYADNLSGKLDISSTIESKINNLSNRDILLAMAGPIRSASWTGAWFGLFIGLLNLLITIII
jgi:tetrahydromethanopterin S-methyltransferase subunit B